MSDGPEETPDFLQKLLAPTLLTQYPPAPDKLLPLMDGWMQHINPHSPTSLQSSLKNAETSIDRLNELGIDAFDEHRALFDENSRKKIDELAIDVSRIHSRLKAALEQCDFKPLPMAAGIGVYSFKPSIPKEQQEEIIASLKETMNFFNRMTQSQFELDQHCNDIREGFSRLSAWELEQRDEDVRQANGGKTLPPEKLIDKIENLMLSKGTSIWPIIYAVSASQTQHQLHMQLANTVAMSITGVIQNLEGRGKTMA